MGHIPDKLVEGESYLFTIHNQVTLAPGEPESFILLGPDNKRYLLNSSNYENYNLKTGQIIRCKVDKVNCSGRVFLEPEHPFYKAGKKYEFIVTKATEKKDVWGRPVFTAWVKDIFDNEWQCTVDSIDTLIPLVSKLTCRIKRIRKAELILSLPDLERVFPNLKINKSFMFKIVDIKEVDYVDYFVLKDRGGKFHLIQKNHYTHYGFEIGKVIRAKVIDRKADLSYKIEPDNPYYKIDKTYYLKFLKIERELNAFNEIEGIIYLEDNYGQMTQVKAHPWQVKSLSYSPEMVKCRVVRLKKGKLQLENLEVNPLSS